MQHPWSVSGLKRFNWSAQSWRTGAWKQYIAGYFPRELFHLLSLTWAAPYSNAESVHIHLQGNMSHS